ncbi:Aste57867_15259 [Aphanomyces stellatus]|uniref:Aste57867_15259 protein n=1 Tax=Aphanomyces stellatus TaxID=120398 RepID=A0A485L2R0_9STRA|nr:hypothetical protein As57867_015203 [Aphanomyces stellatus]VFT92068.1 Aste57867_15259 [Aphanomyces stellatus]
MPQGTMDAPVSHMAIASMCQVCLNVVPHGNLVTSICNTSCRASICVPCLETFIFTRIHELPVGTVAALPCPHCLVSVNLLQWTRKCVALVPAIQAFASHVRAACDVVCPSCHTTSNLLPSSSRHVAPLQLPPRLKDRLPELIRRSRQFCRHQLPAAHVWHFLCASFPSPHRPALLQRLLVNIQDTERRCTLFLCASRSNALVHTPCCRAPVCFACKESHAATDHACRATALSGDVVVVSCPNCSMRLVKESGCDVARCVCSHRFSWATQVVASKWRRLSPHQKALLAKQFTNLQPQAALSKKAIEARDVLHLQQVTWQYEQAARQADCASIV